MAEEDLPQLCQEQEDAVESILSGDTTATVLTGCAGSGKSVVVKTLLKRHPDKFRVCSTTAMSALLVGGCTVDKLFCFRRRDWSVPNRQRQAGVLQGGPRYIIIDEASMVGANMGKIIQKAAERYNKRIILVGDWAQARPVQDDWPFGLQMFAEADRIILRENHRQHDAEYISALNDLRRGECSESTDKFFSSLVHEDAPETAVRIMATNAAVDEYNRASFEAHAENTGCAKYSIDAVYTDTRPVNLRTAFPVSEEKKCSALLSSPLAHKEPISLGCRVIITYNVPGAVNGDSGVVERLPEKPGMPLVIQLDRTGKSLSLQEIELKVYSAFGETEAVLKGFPYRLGYALTIHKAQGMTLQETFVDVGSVLSHPAAEDGRHGLAYVALSRTTTPAGLRIVSWDKSAVHTSSFVLPFIDEVGSSNAVATEEV